MTTITVRNKWKTRKVRVKTTWGKVISSWIDTMSFTGAKTGDKWYGQTKGIIMIKVAKTGKKYQYYGSYADYKYMREAKGPIKINGSGSHGWRISFFSAGQHKFYDKRFRRA